MPKGRLPKFAPSGPGSKQRSMHSSQHTCNVYTTSVVSQAGTTKQDQDKTIQDSSHTHQNGLKRAQNRPNLRSKEGWVVGWAGEERGWTYWSMGTSSYGCRRHQTQHSVQRSGQAWEEGCVHREQARQEELPCPHAWLRGLASYLGCKGSEYPAEYVTQGMYSGRCRRTTVAEVADRVSHMDSGPHNQGH